MPNNTGSSVNLDIISGESEDSDDDARKTLRTKFDRVNVASPPKETFDERTDGPWNVVPSMSTPRPIKETKVKIGIKSSTNKFDSLRK